MLIVELDGGQHTEGTDEPRQTWLEHEGRRVLRFWNNEVTDKLNGVLEVIVGAFAPALSRRERETT